MLIWVNMGMAANGTGSGCYTCSCQSWASESMAGSLPGVCVYKHATVKEKLVGLMQLCAASSSTVINNEALLSDFKITLETILDCVYLLPWGTPL